VLLPRDWLRLVPLDLSPPLVELDPLLREPPPPRLPPPLSACWGGAGADATGAALCRGDEKERARVEWCVARRLAG
jgi:hypothetical protein